MIVLLILVIILLAANVINPAFAWHLRGGWMVKGDSEPSDEYLLTQRIGSIFGLVILVPLLIGLIVFK